MFETSGFKGHPGWSIVKIYSVMFSLNHFDAEIPHLKALSALAEVQYVGCGSTGLFRRIDACPDATLLK